VIPEPENLIASFREKLGTMLIGLHLSGVVSTVKLYNQPSFGTQEVHDVPTDGLLTAELAAIDLPVAQAHP
jgi:hypothetical protein